MFYTIYKDFFEFPLLILSDYNVEDTSLWEEGWEENDDYRANGQSVLMRLGSASTGDMIDDPMIVIVSETIDLGRTTHENLKFEDFNYLLFEGTIEFGREQFLQINVDSCIFVGNSKINIKIWGNKNINIRKDLYVEVESCND